MCVFCVIEKRKKQNGWKRLPKNVVNKKKT